MTDLFDILETFVGTPANSYESMILYLAAAVTMVVLLLGFMQLFYWLGSMLK